MGTRTILRLTLASAAALALAQACQLIDNPDKLRARAPGSDGGGLDAQVSDGGVRLSFAKGGNCSADGWCWVNPIPNGNSLNAVWADADGAWVVGSAGVLFHYTG